MKTILIPLIGTLLFILIVGLFVHSFSGKTKLLSFSAEQKKEIKIGDNTLTVAIADSEEERKNGLSNKASLPENEGMLFIFEQKDVYPSFWMRGMLIPIDIIWINDDKVVKIDKNLEPPPKDTPNSALSLYSPPKPIDYILEVNTGYSDKNSLDVGSPVSGI